MPAKIRMGTAQMRLCPPYAPFVRPREILDDAWLAGGGNRKPRCAFYPPGATSVECECVMKDELTTILDAMRAAQAELADYLVSADRNAELTIAKLVGILDRREVVRAMRLLRALERPSGAPQMPQRTLDGPSGRRKVPREALAKASGVGPPPGFAKPTFYLQCRMKTPA